MGTAVNRALAFLQGRSLEIMSIVPLDKHIKLEKDILSVKDAVRVSICHTATVIANGFMHSGTTHDQFLRLLYYIFIL